MKSAKRTARSTKSNSVAVTRKRKNGVARAAGTAVAIIRPLSALSLKETLWETLTDLRLQNMPPNRADAIAAQAREILRTVKTQLQVASQAKRGVPDEIVAFSEGRRA